MAIAVAAHAFSRQDESSTAYTVTNYDHLGGTQQALVVAISARSGAINETYGFTVTWGGAALSQIQGPLGPTINSAEQSLWIGILRNAATGTQPLSIDISGGNVLGCAIKLLSLTGVKQTGNPWGSGANSPVISRESTTTTSITDDLTTTTANSLLVAIAGGIRGSGVTTFSGWSANWTAAGSTQYDNSTALAAPEATAAAAYRIIASSGSNTAATATWAATCTRRSIAIAEILAEVGGGGGSGTDGGVLSVGPITGQDSGQHVLIRRDAIGDQSAAVNTYAIQLNFADIRYRIEGPASIADSGDERILAIRRADATKPELYIDGKLATPSFATAATPLDTLNIIEGPLYIGAGSKDSVSGGWNGVLDEFRWSNSLISTDHLAMDGKLWRDRRLICGIGARNTFGTSKSPIAIPLFVSTISGTGQSIDVVSLIANPSGAAVTLDSVSGASSGTVVKIDVDGRDWAHYTSTTGFVGEDIFTYQISQSGKISSGRVIVTVLKKLDDSSDFVKVATSIGMTRPASDISRPAVNQSSQTIFSIGTNKTANLGGKVVHYHPPKMRVFRLQNCGENAVLRGFSTIGDQNNDTTTWYEMKAGTDKTNNLTGERGLDYDDDTVFMTNGSTTLILEDFFSHGAMDGPNPDTNPVHRYHIQRKFYGRYVRDDYCELDGGQEVLMEDGLLECIHTFISTAGSNKGKLTARNILIHCGRNPYTSDIGGSIPVPGSKFAGRYPNQTVVSGAQLGYVCGKMFKSSANCEVDIKDSIFRYDSLANTGAATMGFPAGIYNNVVLVWLGGGSYPGKLPASGVTVVTGQAGLDFWNSERAKWLSAHGAPIKGTDDLTPADFPFLRP